jgi:hypothetical protein
VLNELSHRLPRDAAVPDVDSGAQDAYGNPAAAGSFPASQRLRRCARQGVGAVAEPSGVDDAKQDRPRYGLTERFGGAGIVALKSASLSGCTR